LLKCSSNTDESGPYAFPNSVFLFLTNINVKIHNSNISINNDAIAYDNIAQMNNGANGCDTAVAFPNYTVVGDYLFKQKHTITPPAVINNYPKPAKNLATIVIINASPSLANNANNPEHKATH